jgi:hypothetical protein
MMHHGLDFFGFILLGVFSDSGFSMFMSFAKFGNFPFIIYSSTFLASYFFSVLSYTTGQDVGRAEYKLAVLHTLLFGFLAAK